MNLAFDKTMNRDRTMCIALLTDDAIRMKEIIVPSILLRDLVWSIL